MKKNYYLFVGQNATTGEPNSITGNLSYYGSILKFKSNEERQLYIDEKTGFSSQEKIVIGGKKEMRQMCLGQTMYNFNQDIDILDYTIKNNDGYWE